jgi:hypothetical protein
MEHNLTIRVSKKPKIGGIVNIRNISVRERILRMLFGRKQKLTIIVPGDTVQEMAIQEIKEGEIL